jgi:hypothetical protein
MGGHIFYVVSQISDLINTVVGGAVDLKDIDRMACGNLNA